MAQKYIIEANLRPFLSDIGLLQAKTGPAKSTEFFWSEAEPLILDWNNE